VEIIGRLSFADVLARGAWAQSGQDTHNKALPTIVCRAREFGERDVLVLTPLVLDNPQWTVHRRISNGATGGAT
jgi:hypothetical protein